MNELSLEIDCHAVRQMQTQDDDFLLLDCREADEYALVHVDGATLIPMSELAARTAELEPHRGRRVVVYCHHGGRSLRTAQWLRQQGFSQAQSLAGGIDVWAQEIDPKLPRY